MSPSGDRRARARAGGFALLGALVTALLTVLLTPGPAQAHAILVGSDPASGAVLAVAPVSVHLRFDEDLAPTFRSAQLVDASGRPLPGARVEPSGARDVVLDLPPLPGGSYGVLWQVLSAEDGHATSGVVVFTVGSAAAAVHLPSAGADGGRPEEVAVRVASLLAEAGAVGGLAVALLVLGSVRRRAPRAWPSAVAAQRRVLSPAAFCAGLGLAVGLIDLWQEAGRLTGGSAGLRLLLAGTRWGSQWALRELGFALALAAICAALSAVPPLWRFAVPPAAATGLAALAAATLTGADALGGHAASAATTEPGRTLAIVLTAVHAGCALVWLGAVPALAVLLWPARRRPDRELLAACRVPFATTAGTSAVLAVATGLYAAGLHLGDLASLAGTTYGRVLVLKVVAVAALLATGAASARRWRGGRTRSGERRPRSSVLGAELLAGAVVLLAAALLGDLVPARSAATSAARTGTASSATSAAARTSAVAASTLHGDLVVTLSASPGRIGVNGFTATVASTRRPAPAPVTAVTLALQQAGRSDEVTLRPVAPGRWFGTGVLTGSDPLRVAPRQAPELHVVVGVGRGGSVTPLPLTLAVAVSRPATLPARSAGPSALVPAHPLAGIADALAAGVLALAVAIGLLSRRRRRHPPLGVGGSPPDYLAPSSSPAPSEFSSAILEDVP